MFNRYTTLDLAESIYQRLLMRDSENPDLRFMLGAIAYETGKYDVAEEQLRHAISIKNTNPAYHNGLGLVLRELGCLDDAVASFKSALLLN